MDKGQKKSVFKLKQWEKKIINNIIWEDLRNKESHCKFYCRFYAMNVMDERYLIPTTALK